MPAAEFRTSRGFTVLTRQDCMRLLERGGVGRIAVPGRPAPTMRPVNFALQDGCIVMRTADPALSAAASKALAASFEFDEIHNEDHRAWNVIVTGKLEALGDDGRLDGRAVNAWAPSEGERSIALRIADVNGREVPEPHVRPTVFSIHAARAGRGREARHRSRPRWHRPWGRSARARQVARALLGPAYRYWFRFSFEHLARIPTAGGALLVANHAGVVPIDAALVMHGIERELDRPVYALHHHGLAAVPALGTLLARAGGVVAHPDNALRLLRDDGQLLLVFPEGAKGTNKPYGDRYRLARFGRGGFVDTAMRAGVPIVPIAIVGTEETMPIMVRLPGGWPVTLNSLMFGPLAAGVHFPVTITARVLEPVELDEQPGLERYPAYRVAAVADMIRGRIQTALDNDRRRSWGGRQ